MDCNFLLVEHYAARLADATYLQYVLARLKVLETDGLLGEYLAPLHSLDAVLIAYVEVVSQVYALKQDVEAPLMV